MIIFFSIPIVAIFVVIAIAIVGVGFGIHDLSIYLLANPMKFIIPMLIISAIIAAVAVFLMGEDHGFKNSISFSIDVCIVASYTLYFIIESFLSSLTEMGLVKGLLLGGILIPILLIIIQFFTFLMAGIPLIISSLMTLEENNITIVSAVYNGISTDANGNTVYPTETVTLLAEISTVNIY